jgi:polyhydroxyalkanoate synthesis regulator phasin
MKITTLRLPEGLYEDIEAEAEELDRSVSEYVRMLLRNRAEYAAEYTGEYANTKANTPANTDEYDELAGRVEALEERVAELEAFNQQLRSDDSVLVNEERRSAGPVSPPEPPQSDLQDRLVAFVKEHGPVTKSDFTAAFEADIDERGIQPLSWWQRHAREQLRESDAVEHTRNVGWHVPSSK